GKVNVVVLRVSVVTGSVSVVMGRVNVVVTGRVSVVTGKVRVVVAGVGVVRGGGGVVVARVVVGGAGGGSAVAGAAGVAAAVRVEASSHGWSSWPPAIGATAMLSDSVPAASSGPRAVPPHRFVAPEAQGGIASASASATSPRSPPGPFIWTVSRVGARSGAP